MVFEAQMRNGELTGDVHAAGRGDHAAFTRLVERHATLVCSVVYAVLGDRLASEEVAQEVFLQAWRDVGQLQDPQAIRGWLRTMARNRAHDHLRTKVRRRRMLQAQPTDPADPTPGALEQLQAREQAQMLDEALAALPETRREVLVLYYRQHRSVREVAEVLGIDEATARKRLSRARASLREGVEQRLGEHLMSTAPGAAFVAGVSTAVAAIAPSTAWAATTAVGGGVAKAVAGASLGTGLGLMGVFAGYRSVLKGARTESERRSLRAFALTNATATVMAGLAFVLLDPIPGSVVALAVLLGTLAATHLLWLPRIVASRFAAEVAEDPAASRRHRRGWAWGLLGLALGGAGGTAGALMGLVRSGELDPLTAALLVQAIAFVGVPLMLWAVVPRALGVSWRTLAMGTVTWLIAAPFLFVVPAMASAAWGPTPLVWAVALSLTAGVVEEGSRALVYLRLPSLRTDTSWAPALVLGLGHGGIEAILFGLPALAGVVQLMVGAGPLPEEAVMAPWGHVLMGVSRLAILVVHVGFTLLVVRAVRRRAWVWLGVAMAAHTALDLAAFALPLVLPQGGMVLAAAALVVATLLAGFAIVRQATDEGYA